MDASPPPVVLPTWAVVSPNRLEHISRVVALLWRWSREAAVDAATAAEWRKAGLLHDALRDATEDALRGILGATELPYPLMHGPAAAELARRDGETRQGVLAAVMYHTTGSAGWSATGRALYCADFLEPGRTFLRDVRAELAASFCDEPHRVFREVVRMRLERTLHKHHPIRPETIDLWNSLV